MGRERPPPRPEAGREGPDGSEAHLGFGPGSVPGPGRSQGSAATRRPGLMVRLRRIDRGREGRGRAPSTGSLRGAVRHSAAGRRPQVEGRRTKTAGRGPQDEDRRSRAAGRRPQVEGRRSRAAGRGPQVDVRTRYGVSPAPRSCRSQASAGGRQQPGARHRRPGPPLRQPHATHSRGGACSVGEPQPPGPASARPAAEQPAPRSAWNPAPDTHSGAVRTPRSPGASGRSAGWARTVVVRDLDALTVPVNTSGVSRHRRIPAYSGTAPRGPPACANGPSPTGDSAATARSSSDAGRGAGSPCSRLK